MLPTVPCACKTNRHCRSSSEQRTSCEKWRTRYQYSRSPWVGEALPQTISNCLTLTELHINFYVYNFSFTLLHFRLLEMPLKNIGGEGLSPKKSKVDLSFVFVFCFLFVSSHLLWSCGSLSSAECRRIGNIRWTKLRIYPDNVGSARSSTNLVPLLVYSILIFQNFPLVSQPP